MKAVILGDTHFGVGYSIGKTDKHRRLNSRLLDFSKTFDYIIDYMISNEIKQFIITGDIFEYRRPQAAELSLFAEKIQRLEENNINTHIVAGNHDFIIDQRTTTVDILQKLKLPKTFVYSDVDSIICSDNKSTLNFVFLPYRTRSILNCSTNKDAVDRLSERIGFELDKFSDGHRLIVGHFMFKNTMLGSLALERNSDEVVLPQEMFGDFDGTIAGHIHQHQIIQQDPLIAYIGSMDVKDFGESTHQKYFLVVDNSNDDIVFQFEPLPVRKLHDIVLDTSAIDDINLFYDNIKIQISEYAESHNMNGSIVRINVYVSDRIILEMDREVIKQFMKEEFKISHCVGIHPFVISKKQLRKASITEKNDPIESFNEYLDSILVNEKEDVKIKLREFGSKIIVDGSK
jgi:exonuclease SbcD